VGPCRSLPVCDRDYFEAPHVPSAPSSARVRDATRRNVRAHSSARSGWCPAPGVSHEVPPCTISTPHRGAGRSSMPADRPWLEGVRRPLPVLPVRAHPEFLCEAPPHAAGATNWSPPVAAENLSHLEQRHVCVIRDRRFLSLRRRARTMLGRMSRHFGLQWGWRRKCSLPSIRTIPPAISIRKDHVTALHEVRGPQRAPRFSRRFCKRREAGLTPLRRARTASIGMRSTPTS